MRKTYKISLSTVLILLIFAIVGFYICNKTILTKNNYNSNFKEDALASAIQDAIKPTLKSINAEVLSANIPNFATVDDKVQITVTFSETVTYNQAPELKIKFGNGTVRTANCQGVDGSNIIYMYYPVSGDNGELSIESFKGTVSDLSGNNSNIDITGTYCSGKAYSCTPIQCAGGATGPCTNPSCQNGMVPSGSICSICYGQGTIPCSACGGQGDHWDPCTNPDCDENGEYKAFISNTVCTFCAGDGHIGDICNSCGGKGVKYLCPNCNIEYTSPVDSCSSCTMASWLFREVDCNMCDGETCSSCGGTGGNYKCDVCGADWSNVNDTCTCGAPGWICRKWVDCTSCLCTECKGTGLSYIKYKCPICNGEKYIPNLCDECSLGTIPCSNCQGGSIPTDCNQCDNGWQMKQCEHELYESHYYCEHSTNTTNQTHYYCDHNTNGQQHELEGILTEKNVTADTTAPTITSVTGNPTQLTEGNVTLTVNGAKDDGVGLATEPYSFDGGNTWQAESSKTYTKNTSGIVIKVKDKFGNIYTHETIDITKIKLSIASIEVTKMPTKTEYQTGEDFKTDGMEVTVKYSDGSTEKTTNYTVVNGNDLTCLVKKIEIKHNESSEIKTEIDITVKHNMKDATCTEAAKCKTQGCNYEQGEALGHDMKEATCREAAKCKREGCTYTQGEALGHDIKEATCTEAAKCKREGCTYTQGEALGHDMKEATCEEAAKCKREGCTYTQGEALGHNYEEEVTEPTCTEKGYTTHKCKRCNDEYVDTYTDEKGHSFTNYESNNNATCEEDGTETATCDRNGCTEKDTRVDAGSKKPHDYENGECTNCGEEEPKEPEVTITSPEYTILEAYVTKIPDNTTLKTFIENLETNAEEIKVTDNENQELSSEDIVATGMTLTLKLGNETRTYKLVVVGDSTGDGKADFKDIVLMNRHRLHKVTLSEEYIMAGDVTEDDTVDFKDIVQVNRYRLRKILQLFKIS